MGAGQPETPPDEYPVLPADPPVVERSVDFLARPGGWYRSESRPTQPTQWRLGHLLWALTAAGVVLSVLACLPAAHEVVAGWLGTAVLVSLVVLSLWNPGERRPYLAWSCLLGVYLLASLVAVVKQWQR